MDNKTKERYARAGYHAGLSLKRFFAPEKILIAVLIILALEGCQAVKVLRDIEYSISQH